ncbi:MAG: hypothetical protein ACXVHB_19045 [Solirubrobacteraceae bacterium]
MSREHRAALVTGAGERHPTRGSDWVGRRRASGERDKDLLRRQAKGPLPLLERIKCGRQVEALDGYALEVAATTRALIANDVEPVRNRRVIASLKDAPTTKLVCFAKDELGSPPAHAFSGLAAPMLSKPTPRREASQLPAHRRRAPPTPCLR